MKKYILLLAICSALFGCGDGKDKDKPPAPASEDFSPTSPEALLAIGDDHLSGPPNEIRANPFYVGKKYSRIFTFTAPQKGTLNTATRLAGEGKSCSIHGDKNGSYEYSMRFYTKNEDGKLTELTPSKNDDEDAFLSLEEQQQIEIHVEISPLLPCKSIRIWFTAIFYQK